MYRGRVSGLGTDDVEKLLPSFGSDSVCILKLLCNCSISFHFGGYDCEPDTIPIEIRIPMLSD